LHYITLKKTASFQYTAPTFTHLNSPCTVLIGKHIDGAKSRRWQLVLSHQLCCCGCLFTAGQTPKLRA